MLTLNEYFAVKAFCETHNLNEGRVSEFVRKLASKYFLNVAVVMSILNGVGCAGKDSCPTPIVQQQIKQDFKQLTDQKTIVDDDIPTTPSRTRQARPEVTAPVQQSVASADIIEVAPKTYELVGKGRINRIDPSIADEAAYENAMHRLAEHLKVRNISVSNKQIVSSKVAGGFVIITFRITVR